MSIKKQILAYLVDGSGEVFETHPIYAKDPEHDVEQMNKTAKAATDGNLFWTLDKPKEAA